MAAKSKTTIDCLLPLEIWAEILIRLPAKSILQFRSVCKSWYSLISSPNFISDYSVKTLNKNGHRVLLQYYDTRGYVKDFPFISFDESFMRFREHDEVPEAFLDSNVEIVGSCNGLVCLCKYDHGETEVNFLIWNPTIKKVVEIPSGSDYFSSDSFSYYGFGFDSKTGDYKVMCTRSKSSKKNLCEIFDLKKGVWRRISPLVDSWEVSGRTPECYLDGAAHWSGFTTWILLSFDMSDEIFREIRMPDYTWFDCYDDDVDRGDDDYRRVETRCVAFGGLIHLIVWKTLSKREGYCVDMDMECSVWAMKEYGVAESWTKLFNIDLLGAGVHEYIEPKKFRLWGDGEVLMVHCFSEDEDDYDDDEECGSDEHMELGANQGLLLKDEGDDDDEYDWDEHMELGSKQGLLLYNGESGKCKLLFSFPSGIADMCLYEESLVLM